MPPTQWKLFLPRGYRNVSVRKPKVSRPDRRSVHKNPNWLKSLLDLMPGGCDRIEVLYIHLLVKEARNAGLWIQIPYFNHGTFFPQETNCGCTDATGNPGYDCHLANDSRIQC